MEEFTRPAMLDNFSLDYTVSGNRGVPEVEPADDGGVVPTHRHFDGEWPAILAMLGLDFLSLAAVPTGLQTTGGAGVSAAAPHALAGGCAYIWLAGSVNAFRSSIFTPPCLEDTGEGFLPR